MDSTNNYLNTQDMYAVFDKIPELKIRKWEDEDIKMLFKILYWSALRPSEGIYLSRQDFNFNNRTISLHQTKTKKNDIALIPTRFLDELKFYVESKDEGRLFDGLVYNTFYKWCKKLGKICNVEAWITPQEETGEKTVGHIFRKSIGKAMLEGEIVDKNGKPFLVPVVSKHLRHSKPSVTEDHYLKASRKQVSDIF